ncbi:MAG: leucine-rich repeat protein [Firmicutes bacterium]|nr:leucine-rich repeat protein [Bacillota bacterium]
MKNKFISLFFILGLALVLLPASSPAAGTQLDSGSCGNGVTWNYSDGVLTISGSGRMDDYESVPFTKNDRTGSITTAPWANLLDSTTEIVVEDGVSHIGDYAFYTPMVDSNSATITAVEMADSVTDIGEYAFFNNVILEKVQLSGSVTAIEKHAFDKCMKMQSISLPEGLETIEESAFCDCGSLSGITLPESLQEIGAKAFSGSQLTSATIPPGIKTLKDSCFESCSSLVTVHFCDSLTEIGAKCFKHCSKLKEIVLPDSVTVLGDGVFDSCYQLTDVQLSKNLTALPNNSFYWCYSLKSIELQGSVSSIGDQAFYMCSALKEITIPDNVETVGKETFSRCDQLKEIEFGNSVKSIGNGAFYDCKVLESVILPHNLETIGSGAFQRCSSLKEIIIPDSVTSLGAGTFQECSKLNYVRIPMSVKVLSSGLFEYSALEYLSMPSSVTHIENYAFHGCEGLKAIEYYGTEAQLNALDVGEWNDILFEADWYLTDRYPDAYYGLYDLPSENNWAYPGIAFCLDNAIMNGMGEGLFQPSGSTTRAQLVTILYRLMGSPEVKNNTPFTDLKQDWYKNAVAWAYENGIVNGMSTYSFAPDTPINREMMVTIFYRMTDSYLHLDVSQKGDLSIFPDASKVSVWAKDGMIWGNGTGLISGVATGAGVELQPAGTATRAQIAKVILSYYTSVLEPILE